ncbi:DUF3800 domain-containing protein [Sphingomonas sp. RIT328]|uniref:DUF3800 domain-containing protein n=1 Tax=Sphingomonas sp. RIT328 TaxID=1470591 RepID=UPI00044A3FF2|nr:DUF3800 domain-containing protein [Sphingomonas sp. RIT328]EZP51359.1 hypothetical protein BW41_02790 [Sphingomonas sp. RIT328]
MAQRLNKKVLCFIDESGTAGAAPFQLGAVFVLASEAGRLDKAFSDLLPADANEVHAVRMDDGYLQGLLDRLRANAQLDRVVMINQQFAARPGEPAEIYAQAVVDTVKAGMKRFRVVLGRESVDNVDVITDVNHHNDHPAFDAYMTAARVSEGRFRGVNRVARLDSGASRLLQLADVVAYARRWIIAEDVNAQGLRERFGIHLL